jgi:hypothetical protein
MNALHGYVSSFFPRRPRVDDTMIRSHSLQRAAFADQKGHCILPKLLFGWGVNLIMVRRNGAFTGIQVNRLPPSEPGAIFLPHEGQFASDKSIRQKLVAGRVALRRCRDTRDRTRAHFQRSVPPDSRKLSPDEINLNALYPRCARWVMR